MSSWHEERRADKAAAAATRREDRVFDAKLQRDEARKDREEKRNTKVQARRDRIQRRQARAARREKTFTPGNVYKRGTLLLITLSAAASLPAQVLHFVGISWMLFPIGPAVEGAAWVMAAGVAYADETRLAPWVRWLLRALSLSAAIFAASINYKYGLSLQGDDPRHGLTAGQAQTAGLGLAAVTIGGPLFFEVRQWVLTLSASVLTPKQQADAKARKEHEKARAKAFPDVAARQRELILAAPYGSLKEEDAFGRAWADIKGAPRGTSASTIADRLEAEEEVAAVVAERERAAVDDFLTGLFPPERGDDDESGTTEEKPDGDPQGGAPKARKTLGGKGKRRSRSTSDTGASRPLDEADLNTVRKLAEALGGTHRLSAKNVRETVGCRNDYALRLRDAVRSEGDEK
ncbi:hypothetical protein [Streptomyces sp. DW26H14]|uniref:hypothetical protein n=1 Tax=Streptomyces sp. DW26H14 TaxID=3435395 RepID=UPI00403D77F6